MPCATVESPSRVPGLQSRWILARTPGRLLAETQSHIFKELPDMDSNHE